VLALASPDLLRRAQGAVLDLAGLGPSECDYKIAASRAGWRLRAYSGSSDGPAILVVAAPIKRPYIWDLAPSSSAIRACMSQGLRVYLIEWIPCKDAMRSGGLIQYAEEIGKGVACVATDTGKQPFLIGHSLGGTLAAIYAALEAKSTQGLVLLSSPLCFRPGISRFSDTLGALAPIGFTRSGPIPGSLISQFSALASPEEFVWGRSVDAALSTADAYTAELHMRIERWMLDEVPLSGELVRQVLQWLYREDRFCRGLLAISDKVVGPSCLQCSTLAVVNTADRVAPPESVTDFLQSMHQADTKLILFPREIGVCLQHLAVLVGQVAHARIWPAIISWIKQRS